MCSHSDTIVLGTSSYTRREVSPLVACIYSQTNMFMFTRYLFILLAISGWCGKNTKITIPTAAMTMTDSAAKTVAMQSRVRVSCRVPKR